MLGHWCAFIVLTLSAFAALAHHSVGFSNQSLKSDAALNGIEALDTPFPGSLLYLPRDGLSNHRAIVVLHGSDGGDSGYVDYWFAIPLAQRGFAVLAYDYFHSPGQSRDLHLVSVDRVFAAMDWLRRSGHARGKVGLFGVSRGAEFAVLLGSLDRGKRIAAIAAHSPHATTWPSLHFSDDGSFGGQAPAWRYRGRDIAPFQKIDMWRFPGPVLLSHGKKDTLWPYQESVTLSREAKRRGKKNVTLKLWPKEPHGLSRSSLYALERMIGRMMKRELAGK